MKRNYPLIDDRVLFFVVLIMSAMLALTTGAGGFSWLTERQLSNIGALLLMWLIITLALNLIFSALLRRLDAWLASVFVNGAAAPVGEDEDAATGEDEDAATGEDEDAATGEDEDAATGEDEDAATGEDEDAPGDAPLVPPRYEMLLRYLALRATLQWHYREDPYRQGRDVADNYRHADLILSRHAYEKLTAWAERNNASLSDAAERMLLNGMADEHLTNIIREEGWGDDMWEEHA